MANDCLDKKNMLDDFSIRGMYRGMVTEDGECIEIYK